MGEHREQQEDENTYIYEEIGRQLRGLDFFFVHKALADPHPRFDRQKVQLAAGIMKSSARPM
jgi:hypothetical protein